MDVEFLYCPALKVPGASKMYPEKCRTIYWLKSISHLHLINILCHGIDNLNFTTCKNSLVPYTNNIGCGIYTVEKGKYSLGGFSKETNKGYKTYLFFNLTITHFILS